MNYDFEVPTFTLAPGVSPLPLLQRIVDPDARSMAKTLFRIRDRVQEATRSGWVSEIRAYPEAVAVVIHREGEGGAYSEQAAIVPYRDVSAARRDEVIPIPNVLVSEREIEDRLPWTEEEDPLFPQAKTALYALSALF